MNEKSMEVLSQYDFEVHRVMRARGGMVLNTNKGDKLLLECIKQDKYYQREDNITKIVESSGYINVDTYCNNIDGELISLCQADGRKYVVKNWFRGQECNVRNVKDICDAVRALAKLHIALENASSDICQSEHIGLGSNDVLEAAVRRMREIGRLKNYLKTKKQKSDYEVCLYKNCHVFYNQAREAVERLNRSEYKERLSEGRRRCELIHGSYNYHNVFINMGEVYISNFEKLRIDIQVQDLYQFMRKILEKYNWDIDLAYRMINEYDNIRPLSDVELEIMGVLFMFPEKFWKLINYYYNMNKSWVSPKSVEKLKLYLEQNEQRTDFLATLCMV